MANFCPQCGQPVAPGAAFCGNCGARLEAAPVQQTQQQAQPYAYQQPQQTAFQQPQQAVYQQPRQGAYSRQARFGIPPMGFSDRLNDPELAALVKHNEKAGNKFLLPFMLVPIIGFPAYAMFTDGDMGAAVLQGVVVAAVIAACFLYGKLKSRTSNGYDAVVVDKYTRTVFSDDDSGDENVTVVRTTAGKTIKLKDDFAWDYLPTGARFRYHPNLAFPYELYDKSQTDTLYCPVCRRANPVENDRCEKCNAPLLK